MSRPKPTYCTNCGEGIECKTFTRTGKACRKGKGKGKKVSESTQKKREKYLEQLDELQYDYSHEQDSKVFWAVKKAGYYEKNFQLEILFDKPNIKYISFYRWLKNKEYHTLASWYQRNCDASNYDYDYNNNFFESKEDDYEI